MVTKRLVVLSILALSVGAAFTGTLWNVREDSLQGQLTAGSSVTIDDGDAGFRTAGQGWQRFQHALGYGGDLVSPAVVTDPNLSATWTFSNVTAGSIKIYVTFKAYSLLTNQAPYTIRDGTSTIGTATVNQKVDPSGNVFDGKNWVLLGTYTVRGPTVSVTLSRPQALTTNGVIADAVRIERVAVAVQTSGLAPAAPQTGSVPSLSGSNACRDGFTRVQGGNYPYITCSNSCGGMCNIADYYQLSGSAACCKCGLSPWCASSSSESINPVAVPSEPVRWEEPVPELPAAMPEPEPATPGTWEAPVLEPPAGMEEPAPVIVDLPPSGSTPWYGGDVPSTADPSAGMWYSAAASMSYGGDLPPGQGGASGQMASAAYGIVPPKTGGQEGGTFGGTSTFGDAQCFMIQNYGRTYPTSDITMECSMRGGVWESQMGNCCCKGDNASCDPNSGECRCCPTGSTASCTMQEWPGGNVPMARMQCTCQPIDCPPGYHVGPTNICLPNSVCGDGYLDSEGFPRELCETGTNHGCAPGRNCISCKSCGLCGNTILEQGEACEADYGCGTGNACDGCACVPSSSPLTANMITTLDLSSPNLSQSTNSFGVTVHSWTLPVTRQVNYDIYAKIVRSGGPSNPCPLLNFWRISEGTMTIPYGQYLCYTWPDPGKNQAWVKIGSTTPTSSVLTIEHSPPPPPVNGNSVTYPAPAGLRLVRSFSATDVAPLGVSLIDNGDQGFRTSGGEWEERQFPMPPPSVIGPVTSPLFDDDITLKYGTVPNASYSASWNFTVTPGRYRVLVTYATLSVSNFVNKNAVYSIRNGSDQVGSATVDHTVPPNGPMYRFVSWKVLGTYSISGNRLSVVLTNPYGLSTDAVRIEPLDTPVSSSSASHVSSAVSSAGPLCQSQPWQGCQEGFFCLAQCPNGQCLQLPLDCPPGTTPRYQGICGNNGCLGQCGGCIATTLSSSSRSSIRFSSSSTSSARSSSRSSSSSSRISVDYVCCVNGRCIMQGTPCVSDEARRQCTENRCGVSSSSSSAATCAREGEIIDEASWRPCCSGLVAWPNLVPQSSGQCPDISFSLVCIRQCGNRQCTTGENYCNCPQDCPLFVSSSSSSSSRSSSSSISEQVRFCCIAGLCQPSFSASCPYTSYDQCKLACGRSSSSVQAGRCGDGQLNPGEQCEANIPCPNQQFCNRDTCQCLASYCGNDRVEGQEQCDGSDNRCTPDQTCSADCRCVNLPLRSLNWRTVGESYLVSTISEYALFSNGNYLYIVGGKDFWGQSDDEFRSDNGLSWRRVASLPQPLSNAASVKMGEYGALLLGGLADESSVVHWAFETPNLLSVAFRSNPELALPVSRYDAAALRVGNRTYLLGGSDKASPFSGSLFGSLLSSLIGQTAVPRPSREIYVHNGTSWSRIQPDLPFHVTKDDAFSIGDSLFILDRSSTRKVYRSSNGSSWTQVATLPSQTANVRLLRPVTHNGAVWLIGKTGSFAGSAVVTQNGTDWQVVSGPLPSDLNDFVPDQAVSHQGELWILGTVSDYYIGGSGRNGKVLVTGAAGGPTCGNGGIEGNEQCDDQNTRAGDGCSTTCQIERGWTCDGQPSICTRITVSSSSSSSSMGCANNGEKVYGSSIFGPTSCCSRNAGIRPSSSLVGDMCVAPNDGSLGTCVDNWWQTCGDGSCGHLEDKCTCEQDCPDCTPAGKTAPVIPGSTCCPGLTGLAPIRPLSDGSCPTMLPAGAMLCSDCGNGTCEEWENHCNCPQDCRGSAPVCGNGQLDPEEDSQCEPSINYDKCPLQKMTCDKTACRCIPCPALSPPYCPNGVLVPQLGPGPNGCPQPPVCCSGANNPQAQCSINLTCGNGSCFIASCTCQ